MERVILAGGADVAELAFWAFILFFIGLVFYLRREDRREGYPLENELTGRLEDLGGPLTVPTPKVFRLPFGQGEVLAPRPVGDPLARDRRDIAARPYERHEGTPFVPTGDPFVDGVGPASWCERMHVADRDVEGKLRIQPLSTDPDFFLAREDPDLRGFAFVGSDGIVGGRVADIWFDRSDRIIRYLTIETAGGRHVLAPMTMVEVDRGQRLVRTDSIAASQLPGAPWVATDGEITRYEEDRVLGYFGGGYLYATPSRAEPLV